MLCAAVELEFDYLQYSTCIVMLERRCGERKVTGNLCFLKPYISRPNVKVRA